mmetsp:Transcript_30692/g.66359  ORF Transcript_30692/g.66359 Transcript_30692/m.66359 type:complete len:264 (-) Transcript_30692:837-1628(-)
MSDSLIRLLHHRPANHSKESRRGLTALPQDEIRLLPTGEHEFFHGHFAANVGIDPIPQELGNVHRPALLLQAANLRVLSTGIAILGCKAEHLVHDRRDLHVPDVVPDGIGAKQFIDQIDVILVTPLLLRHRRFLSEAESVSIVGIARRIVAEYSIGFGQVEESFHVRRLGHAIGVRRRRMGILLVGMVFERLFSIGASYFFRVGIRLDAQHVVIFPVLDGDARATPSYIPYSIPLPFGLRATIRTPLSQLILFQSNICIFVIQ